MRQLLATCFLFLVCCCVAQEKENSSQKTLHYILRPVADSMKHPGLVILLHGYGANESDLFAFSNKIPSNFIVVSPRAPYELKKGSYCWSHVDFNAQPRTMNTEEALESKLQILQMISEIRSKYPIDSNQIFIGGFSQGGIITYSIALQQPTLAKGFFIWSGRLVAPLIQPSTHEADRKNLNLFISHGTNDAVIHVNEARIARQILLDKQIPLCYKEYNCGHTISEEMFGDWLLWLIK